MPFRMKCSAGHSLIVPDSRAGKTVRCPRCEVLVEVPQRPRAIEPLVNASVEVPTPKLPAELPQESLAVPPIAPPVVVPAVAAEVAKEVVKVPAPVIKPVVAPPVQQKTVAVVVANEGAFAPAVISPSTVAATPQIPSPVEKVPPVKVAAAPIAVTTPAPVHLPPVVVPKPVANKVVEKPSPVAAEKPAVTSSVVSLPIAEEAQAAARPVMLAATIDPSTQLWGKQIALGLLVTALFSSAPGLWDFVDYLRNPEEMFVARWALVLLVLGTLQAAYATYLWQLADWTSLWVVTLLSLAIASGFAMMLGIVLVAGEESQLIGALQLQDRLIGNKAHLWCLCMIAVYTVVAFFAGRACTHWHRREQLLEALSLS